MTSTPPPLQNRGAGIALRLAGATSFAFMAALIKMGFDRGVSTPELVFYRFAFGLPPLIGWILWSRNFDVWRTERPLMHLSRAVMGLATMVLAFSALAYLPLAEATTISFAAPLFAVVLSALLLKETVGKHRWTAVLLGFAGVLIVTRPGGGGDLPFIGLILAITAAVGVAFVNIMIRQIGRTEEPQTTVLWFTVSSMLVVGTIMPFFAQAHDMSTWAVLVGVGIFGGLGQLFLTASLRSAPVPVIVPFDYTQILWAVLLGWLIWNTHAPVSTWAGAAVIIGSGLYTIYREHRLGRDKPKAIPPL